MHSCYLSLSPPPLLPLLPPPRAWPTPRALQAEAHAAAPPTRPAATNHPPPPRHSSTTDTRRGCHNLSDESMIAVANNCPNLAQLNVT